MQGDIGFLRLVFSALAQKRQSPVDNYYVKQLLGLGDFRVQSHEAIEKWFALVFLAYTFLQWRLNHTRSKEGFKVVADVIRFHRHQHARHILEAACRFAVSCGDMTQVLQRFISQRALVAT